MSKEDRAGSKDYSELRRRAEELLSSHLSAPGGSLPDEVQRLMHELEVHQIELEMQNHELREAQQQLESSRDRYADLYDFAPLGYVSLDAHGWIREINLTGAAMLGSERAGLIGHALANWVAKEDRRAFRDHLRRCRAEEEEVNSELSLVAREGRSIRVHLRSIPGWDPELATKLYRTAVTDITERIEAEEEQRKLHAQVEHAQKLESLGVLAGGIAHDFNNLLTTILGNTELALQSLPPPSPTRETIDEIRRAAVRAAELTLQMLAYAGKGRSEIGAVNLNEVVEETSQLLHASISRNATLKLDLAQNLPRIDGDAGQIRQILMNLIMNASEAGGDEGVVITLRTSVVEAGRSDLSETYLEEHLPEGPYVCLEVSDTGCGMDEETQSKLFDPFFTTKFAGRGLGLAAVLGIIRNHHGTVEVRSQPGKGTTIKVLLPVGVRAYQEATEVAAADSHDDSRGRGRTILVVDDEEGVRNVAAEMLTGSGFCVLTAPDGRQAVELFANHHDEVVLVLLDMTMPGQSSEKTLQELRQIRSDVPVLICSGYTQENVTSRFTGGALAGFLQKPFDRKTLVGTIQEALEHHS